MLLYQRNNIIHAYSTFVHTTYYDIHCTRYECSTVYSVTVADGTTYVRIHCTPTPLRSPESMNAWHACIVRYGMVCIQFSIQLHFSMFAYRITLPEIQAKSGHGGRWGKVNVSSEKCCFN